MSYEERVDMVTLVAGYDASLGENRFVVTANTGKAVLAGAGVVPSGVVTVGAPINHGIRVAVKGIAPVEAGGPITAGDSIATAASGKAVLAGASIVVGIAQASADGGKTTYVSGDIVPVLLV